jgi:kynurenine formamidase
MPDQPTIDQVPVERFMVRSAVLQLADKMPREHITLAHLTGAGVDVQPGMGILVAAGWDRMWRDTGFFWESPHFTREAMQWIGDKRPAILGLDFPSSNDPRAPEGLNSIIFATGTLLLAPLVNLRRLSKQYIDLIALPLRIPGLCGTPCRAVAIER